MEIIGIIVSVFFLMIVGAAIEVWISAKAKLRLLEADDIKYKNKGKISNIAYDWSVNNNFECLGAYKIGHYFMVTWKHSGSSTFLCFHTFPDRGIEFITVFGNNIILCTVNSSNWQAPPHFSGYYLQTFSRIGIDKLWQRHQEAESYLMEIGKTKLCDSEISIEECLNYYRKKQTDHIRSFTAWPIRAFYWNFVSKYFWHNKSIEQQYKEHMIKLPNDFLDCIPLSSWDNLDRRNEWPERPR